MDEAETLCDRLVSSIVDGHDEGTPDEVRGEHRSLESAYLALITPTFGKAA